MLILAHKSLRYICGNVGENWPNIVSGTNWSDIDMKLNKHVCEERTDQISNIKNSQIFAAEKRKYLSQWLALRCQTWHHKPGPSYHNQSVTCTYSIGTHPSSCSITIPYYDPPRSSVQSFIEISSWPTCIRTRYNFWQIEFPYNEVHVN